MQIWQNCKQMKDKYTNVWIKNKLSKFQIITDKLKQIST